MGTKTSKNKKQTARQFIASKAMEYCKKHLDLINNVDLLSNDEEDELTEKKINQFKTDPYWVDWFMSEIIYPYSLDPDSRLKPTDKLPFFCKLIKHEWVDGENIRIAIYKFDDVYIKMTYDHSLNYSNYSKPEVIEFVKPIERKVIVYDWEVIE